MSYIPKNSWGSYLWGFIHTITIIDFENNKEYNDKTKEQLVNIRDCIPCYKCKNLYKEYLEKLDNLDMTKSLVLFYWSVDLHNEVNKKLNKPEWTYHQALNEWANKRDFR